MLLSIMEGKYATLFDDYSRLPLHLKQLAIQGKY